MRRYSSLLFVVLAFLPGITLSAQVSDEAKRIQSHVLGVDSHNDTLQRVLIEGVDIGKRLPDGSVDLPRLREGGMDVRFFALWVPMYYHGAEAVRRTLDLRDAMQGVLDKYPDQIELATSGRDIRHNRQGAGAKNSNFRRAFGVPSGVLKLPNEVTLGEFSCGSATGSD